MRRCSWPALPMAAVLAMAAGAMRAAEPVRPDVEFGIVADAQYADQPARGTRFYRESLAKLRGAVEDFNARPPDFVIHLGDLIDTNLASVAPVQAVFDRLVPPRYHALGNHDFAVAPEERAGMPARLGMERRYYDFARGGWRFVVLDSSDVAVHSTAPGTPEHAAAAAWLAAHSNAPNARTWNGALGAAQLEWLRRTLADAAAQDQKAVLFCHQPVYPAGVHNAWNAAEVVALLDTQPHVIAWINGHNHAGGYACRRGVHYLTVHGMVETSNTTAYARVRAYADRIEVDGAGRQPDYTLRLRAPPQRGAILDGRHLDRAAGIEPGRRPAAAAQSAVELP